MHMQHTFGLWICCPMHWVTFTVLPKLAEIGEEQSTGEQQGPYDEGAMSEGANGGEEEDTWMVKLYKEMERKSKEEVKDPALEAGSRIFDVEASEPAVQRLLGLLQVCD